MLRDFGKRVLPSPLRRWLRQQRRRFSVFPPVSTVRLGGLGRTRPISAVFGLDRGQPIDRYYIERFLERHAVDIRGAVLEVGGDTYLRRFGGASVSSADVLHVEPGHSQTTIVTDLAAADTIRSDAFDCIILTQTLQFIYDLRAAVATLHRILRPGGVLLATVPGISQISRYDMDRWGDYWRFTDLSAHRLFEEAFPPAHLEVESHGNVLAAVAFLHGLAQEDINRRVLVEDDPDYPVIITIRAVKALDAERAS